MPSARRVRNWEVKGFWHKMDAPGELSELEKLREAIDGLGNISCNYQRLIYWSDSRCLHFPKQYPYAYIMSINDFWDIVCFWIQWICIEYLLYASQGIGDTDGGDALCCSSGLCCLWFVLPSQAMLMLLVCDVTVGGHVGVHGPYCPCSPRRP